MSVSFPLDTALCGSARKIPICVGWRRGTWNLIVADLIMLLLSLWVSNRRAICIAKSYLTCVRLGII